MGNESNTKQAAWIALGSLFSFAFGIVSSMILSRYFDKIEYGTYKQVLYVYSSLLAVFTLGLPKAFSYFLPRSPLNEAKSLIRKITNIFFLLGGSLSFLLFVFSDYIADFLNNPELGMALKIFSPVPFLMLPTMGLDGILATYKETRFLAGYTIITRFIMLFCVAIPVVIFDLSCNEALIGFNIGSLISCLLALWLKYYPIKNERNDLTQTTYKDIFRFSLPLLFASIWGVLINSTDQFFISKYFGTKVFAEFSNGAMELPFVGMIIGACSTVLTPLFTKQVYEKADFKTVIYPVWISSFEKSAMLIYPITIFCLFDAMLIMSVMYGDAYAVSGDFFRIKLLTYFVKIISLDAIKFYSNVFMFVFLLLVPAEYISVVISNNPLIVTITHVCFTIAYSLFFLVYIAKRFSTPFWKLLPLKLMSKVIIVSCMAYGLTLLSKTFMYSNQMNLLKLIIDLLLYGSSFVVLSILFKINYIGIFYSLKK